jgi:hypothetical protein
MAILVLIAGCGASSSPAADLATGSSDLAGGAADGGQPFFARCDGGADCASGVCVYYPGRGTTLCTKACTADFECPPVSPGCNNMGVCREP